MNFFVFYLHLKKKVEFSPFPWSILRSLIKITSFIFKLYIFLIAMDDKNENDQIIQEVERKLKIQQEITISQDTQAEKSWRNPYSSEQRFKLISPMYDMVMNQMNIISTCYTVHAHIALTEEDKNNLSKDMLVIHLSNIPLSFRPNNICFANMRVIF